MRRGKGELAIFFDELIYGRSLTRINFESFRIVKQVENTKANSPLLSFTRTNSIGRFASFRRSCEIFLHLLVCPLLRDYTVIPYIYMVPSVLVWSIHIIFLVKKLTELSNAMNSKNCKQNFQIQTFQKVPNDMCWNSWLRSKGIF